MQKIFKSVIIKNDDGWTQGVFGNSQVDGKDYTLTTHCLHGDEVPEVMNDSKSATEFIAGLLNAYFNKVDVRGIDQDKICLMGVIDKERTGLYENPNQKEIPFL